LNSFLLFEIYIGASILSYACFSDRIDGFWLNNKRPQTQNYSKISSNINNENSKNESDLIDKLTGKKIKFENLNFLRNLNSESNKLKSN
jgi:hypothetical protein